MHRFMYKVIRNKTSIAQDYSTCAFNIVRDYHSPVQQALRRSEWFMRLYIHFLMHPSSLVYMLTLTYNDNCIPSFNVVTGAFCHGHINPKKSDYNSDCIPAFQLTDIQNWVKRVNKQLRSYGLVMRYLVTSEFGKNYTKRSHYHAIIFIDSLREGVAPFISEEKLFALLRSRWSIYIGNRADNSPIFYPLGNVYFSKSPIHDSYRITDSSAFRYTTKYITKDVFFEDLPAYQNMPHEHKVKYLKHGAPKHLQSNGFAKGWYHYFNVMESLENGIEVEVKTPKGIITKHMPLPQYCINDLFFGHIYEKVSYTDICGTHVERVHKRYLYKNQRDTYYQYIHNTLRKRAHMDALLDMNVNEDERYRLLLWSQVRSTLWPRFPQDNHIVDIDFFNMMYFNIPSIADLECLYRYMVYNKFSTMSPAYGYDGVKVLLENGFVPLFTTPAGQELDEALFAYYEEKTFQLNKQAEIFAINEEKQRVARQRANNEPKY